MRGKDGKLGFSEKDRIMRKDYMEEIVNKETPIELIVKKWQ